MLISPVQVPPTASDSGYLLIEPSNLRSEVQGLLPNMYACVPTFLWQAEASMPRLLRLEKLSISEREIVSELLQQEISEQYPPAICAWLQSDMPTEELGDRIARLIYGIAPSGKHVIWRYYDPRVFILMAQVFSDEQGHAILGEVERWAFPWRRQWWSVHRNRPFVPSPADFEIGWPTDSQWDLLCKSRLFHTIHARLHEEKALPSQCIDDLKYSIKAFQETEGYIHADSDEQRAEFIYLATYYRNAFRTCHELLPKWEQLRRREITLDQMLTGVTSNDIALIKARRMKEGD